MNLEALALRRADESMETFERDDLLAPGERPLRIVSKRRPSGDLKCSCGNCHTCRNREAMREFRARKRAGVILVKRPGRKTTAGRVCSRCGIPIWDKNVTGKCGQCGRSSDRVARAPGRYSHGGGI